MQFVAFDEWNAIRGDGLACHRTSDDQVFGVVGIARLQMQRCRRYRRADPCARTFIGVATPLPVTVVIREINGSRF